MSHREPPGFHRFPPMIFTVLLALSILLSASTAPAGANWLRKLGDALELFHQTDQLLWLLGDTGAERRFGFLLSRFVMMTQPLDRNKERNRWVRKVFGRVVAKARRKGFQYRVYIVRSRSINAFALPGGYIFVNRGMLDFVRSDDELACVLGHELTHVNRRHALKRLRRNALFISLVNAIWKDRGQRNIAKVVEIFANFKFSRNDEREADRIGMKKAFLAGYNPSGMVTLWDRMLKKYGERRGLLAKLFSTHPCHRERIENARRELAKLGVPFARTDFLTLRLRTVDESEPLLDGGFESNADDGKSTGWKLSNGARIVRGSARTGEGSLYFSRFTRSNKCNADSSLFRLDPGFGLTVSCWARSASDDARLWLGLRFYDRNRKPISTVYPAAEASPIPENVWTRFTGEVRPGGMADRAIPKGAAYYSVVISAFRLGFGECWIDDVSVLEKETGAAPDTEGLETPPRNLARPNLLPNPSFEIDDDGDGRPDRWLCSLSAHRIERRKAPSGKYVLALEGKKKMRREFALSEAVPVNAGSRYVIEALLRASSGGFKAEFGYRFLDKDMKILPERERREYDIPGRRWLLLDFRVQVPVSSPAAFIQVTVRARPPVGRSLLVDDMRLFNADVEKARPLPYGSATRAQSVGIREKH